MSSSRGVFHKQKWKNLLLLSTSIDGLSTQSACTVQCFFLFCSAIIGKEDFDLEQCFALPVKVSQK